MKCMAGERSKKTNTHTHGAVLVSPHRSSLSAWPRWPPIAHTPLHRPDPSSCPIHSSRIYPTSLTQHVSGQMSKKPPFGNRGEEIPPIQLRLSAPQLPSTPRLRSPSFSCSLFSFNTLSVKQHLLPRRESSSPRRWDAGDPLWFFSQLK